MEFPIQQKDALDISLASLLFVFFVLLHLLCSYFSSFTMFLLHKEIRLIGTNGQYSYSALPDNSSYGSS